ncbi:hypothetical protein EYF80_012776 [Liparis tanakae]|uniref:Uncharacterized protein n=1 Tax=Liparis tanakae TaxID=230148 RepID=A0A4Z2IG69_9TELE|nr:hypothetical protein EYF80_012776 [Liparis tanakae]
MEAPVPTSAAKGAAFAVRRPQVAVHRAGLGPHLCVTVGQSECLLAGRAAASTGDAFQKTRALPGFGSPHHAVCPSRFGHPLALKRPDALNWEPQSGELAASCPGHRGCRGGLMTAPHANTANRKLTPVL